MAPGRSAHLAADGGQLPARHGPVHPAGARQAPVARLDAATLDRFYAQLRKQGGKNGRPLAPSTVREVHAILSGALQQATAWGLITQNPARLASPPVVEKAKVRPPEIGQVAELLRAVMQEDLTFGLFLRLAVVLGARRGELCALRWSHVDFERGGILVAGSVIYVPGQPLIDKDTKTHAERRVAAGDDTLEALRTHRIRAAETALAAGVTLGPNANGFSHTPDGQAPIRPEYMTHRSPCSPSASTWPAGCMTCATSRSPSSWPAGSIGVPSPVGPGMRTAT
jgi:integrase